MPDDQNPDENTEPATEAGAQSAAPPPVEFLPADASTTDAPATDAPATAAPSSGSARGWIWGAAALVVVLALMAGAFLVGRSSVDEGPTSLADAAKQTAKGDLPVGDLSLDDITGVLGQSGSGILGGKSGNSDDLVEGLLDTLGKELQNKLEDGLKNGFGSDKSSGGSSTPTTPTTQAYLGVTSTNAAGGGAQVAEVKAGSPAADAGLQAGDVITAVDGKSVANAAALATQVQAHSAGDVVSITYSRNGTSRGGPRPARQHQHADHDDATGHLTASRHCNRVTTTPETGHARPM